MKGPCAKRRVFATLVTPRGAAYHGENLCRRPQKVCPRAPGEGYEKCWTVCGQVQHAEEAALNSALRFHSNLTGSRLYVHHHYACRSCRELADDFGIDLVFTAPPDSEPTPNQ